MAETTQGADGDAGAPEQGERHPGARPLRADAAASRVPQSIEIDQLRASLEDIRRALDDVDHNLTSVRPADRGRTSRATRRDLDLAGYALDDDAPQPTLLPLGGRPTRGAGPTRPRRAHLRSLLTLITAAVLVVVALGVAVRFLTTGDATPSAGPPTDGAPSATVAGAAPAAAGPGGDSPGTGMTVTVAGAALRVQEQLRLAEPASSPLVVVLPLLSDLPSLQLPQPAVSDLSATVDDQPAVVTRTATGWTVAAPGRKDYQRVLLTYQLDEAVVTNATTTADRALLVVTPLTADISAAAGAPVDLRVTNAKVRQASCLAAPVTEQLCGSASADGWLARLPADSTLPLVVFQVNLLA